MSVIETGKSVAETNRSVIDTNTEIVNISKKQEATNKVIADNSTTQTTILAGQAVILKRQTLIFLFTAFFALGAVIVSVIGIIKDNSKGQLQKQLQDTTKELQSLRRQLKQLTS